MQLRLFYLCLIGLGIFSLALTQPSLRAEDTGVTGGGQPVENHQPSLALNSFIVRQGVFPTREGGGGSFSFLGQIRYFAGSSFASPGTTPAGQLLPISQNTAVFSLLGINYGGDGKSTFGLPDLRSKTMIGTNQGPNLSNYFLGEAVGTATNTLLESQLPAHAHTLPAPQDITGMAGGNQPFNNIQPSLPLTFVIATDGIFPSPNSGVAGGAPFLGQIVPFAGNFAPGGFHLADGTLLPIVGNEALFTVIGTIYGGDGANNFALPDLRGRAAVGFGQGPGLTNVVLGEALGTETQTLNVSQLPAHTHTAAVPGGMTGSTGGIQPFNNTQPSLGLNYIIHTQGIFPSEGSGGGSEEPYLSEISLFAGGFAPKGTRIADGSLLPISQNQALFALLGTTYGGDGRTTFALPDLRGRTFVGADGIYPLGTQLGTELTTLTVAQMPAHDHSVPPVPEPSTIILMGLGLLVAAGYYRFS